MVVCVLFLACFVKIAVCNPCITSMTNDNYPAMTTSFTTNILSGEDIDFRNVPLYDSYPSSDIPQEIPFASEDIKLNCQSILSKPMAITSQPMTAGIRTDEYNAELNTPNDYYSYNGYSPKIGASQTDSIFLDHTLFPKYANELQTPRYQCKPFSETFNTFRDNINKWNEANFRNIAPQFDALHNDKNVDEINSEFSICKPSINKNDCQYKFDSPENVMKTNHMVSDGSIEFTNIPFLNPGERHSYNKFNPFYTNVLNQQLLLNNQIQREKYSAKPDADNPNRINIDINLPNNNLYERTIPIEITIIEACDGIIDESIVEEDSCIVIDIYDENINTIDNYNISQQLQKSNTNIDINTPIYYELNDTNATGGNLNATANTLQNASRSPRYNLNEFSSYLAKTILSGLQSFLNQENYMEMDDCVTDNLIKSGSQVAIDFNNSSNNSFTISHQPENCSVLKVNLNSSLDAKESILNCKEKDLNSILNLNKTNNNPPNYMLQANNLVQGLEECPFIYIDFARPEYTDQILLPSNTADIKYATSNRSIPSSTISAILDHNSITTKNSNKKPEMHSANNTGNKPSTHETNNEPDLSSVNCIENTSNLNSATSSTNNTDSTPKLASADSTNSQPGLPPSIYINNDTEPDKLASIRTDNITEISSTNSSVNTAETSSAHSIDNETETSPANSTDNTSETCSDNGINNDASEISESSPMSNKHICVMMDGIYPDNSIVPITAYETRLQTKVQPRLSTITINISPIQENNQQVVVFV